MSSFTPKLQSHHFHFKLRRWRSIRAGRRPKVRLSFIPKLHPSSFHFKLEVRLRSIRSGRRPKVRLSLTPKLQSSSFHFKLSMCRSVRAGRRPKVRLSVTPVLHPSSSQKHIHPRLPPSVMHTWPTWNRSCWYWEYFWGCWYVIFSCCIFDWYLGWCFHLVNMFTHLLWLTIKRFMSSASVQVLRTLSRAEKMMITIIMNSWQRHQWQRQRQWYW